MIDWSLILNLSIPLATAVLILLLGSLRLSSKNGLNELKQRLSLVEIQRDEIYQLLKSQQLELHDQRNRFDQHQINALLTLQEGLQKGMKEVREQIQHTLFQHSQTLSSSMDKLTRSTQEKLIEISGHVDKRLAEGFEKTTATFTDVVRRLSIIDEAQKKITELSSNVVSLQEILSDKRTRGAFGEVQLSALLRNVIPESHFKLQHTLSNGKRVDCMLILPEPTGNVAIDAKFPLENYKQLINSQLSEIERRPIEAQFKLDIRKHIQDIAQKYIIPNETAEGAVMFIPAEAIFAEIHAHHPELVEFAHQSRVWMVSPTTMMAILTTARAVLKDAATRKQVHIIQEHLVALSKDFERFQKRMDNLAQHIGLAHQDIEQVHQSSKKITSRFGKIEKVELTLEESEIVLIEG